MRILHIAPFNIAGVPIEFVRAERTLGHYSRLVTLGRDRRGYEEDICLELPMIDDPILRLVKHVASSKRVLRKSNLREHPDQIPRVWKPRGMLECLLVRLRDRIWESRIMPSIRKYGLLDFDIYQLDGGLGFLRSGKIIKELKSRGKKVVCCYLGSDLRLRGVIPQIDSISDLNLTTEFDLRELHPDIHHIFFPFNPYRFQVMERRNKVLRICHSPTDRKAKGSERIIATVRELAKRYPVRLVLIENLPYDVAIKLKAGCDIMIDQLGELGYGISSLEALAMGIPTLTALTPEYEACIPDHPFIKVDEETLKERLIELIEDGQMRHRKGLEGRRWVERYHDSRTVVSGILAKYREFGWIDEYGNFIC
ncbi:MAG TPA: glycosyltransferase family 1 protein [Candidatus Latescibacteria bacterium]|nr:glycosyltransferase family 1 protein [Candidatus Latescibacterota bacterium]